MDFLDIFRAVFALALTLGLVGLFAVALRRFGPDVLARFQPGVRAQRRMTLIESLVLDPTRRLVLVRLDEEERLILLGEGRLLEPPAEPPSEPKA